MRKWYLCLVWAAFIGTTALACCTEANAAEPAPACPAGYSCVKIAPVPTGLSCADGVVWTGAKTYHLPGSRYYGSTKKGKYECTGAAEKEGLKPSKV